MEVMLGGTPLPYQWKRSARRRTAAITVHPEKGVIVHTPQAFSLAQAEELLRSKAPWVLKHCNRLERERVRRAALRWQQGRLLPYLGAKYPLQFVLDGGREEVALAEGRFLVGLPLQPGAETLEAWARERMLDWYREQARRMLEARVAHFKPLLGVQPATIRIKQQKRRWGSCSAKGALNFNWHLVLAPPEILDYVVVHELCHLIVLNHSPRFWGQVEKILPDYGARRGWLRRNGHTLSL